jgi:putative hydroxymethylpyrimidine transport system permease protein
MTASLGNKRNLSRAWRRGRSSWRRSLLRYLPPVVVIAAGIAGWQLFTVDQRVPDFLLPSPARIWEALINDRDLLLSNSLPTFETAVLGFLLALCLGVAVAIGVYYSRFLELAVYPIIIASQTVPVIALAPILLVIFGYSILPKLIIVCLICFFPMVVNTVDGLKSVDPDLINLMRTLGAGKWRLFRDVVWPTALPYLFSGAKVAVTYSVVGALFGELAGSSDGLEHFMTQMAAQFETAASFASMAVLTVMGIGLFAMVALLERLLLPWQHGAQARDSITRT